MWPQYALIKEKLKKYYHISPLPYSWISEKEKYSSVWWRLSNNLWQNSFYRYWKNINFEWWTHIVRIFECYSFLLITFDLIFFDIWKKMWNSYEKYYAKYLLRLYKRYNILFQYGMLRSTETKNKYQIKYLKFLASLISE